jgi:phosphoenolpyruvate synthase/pyruvate phosphate dikinase
VTAPAQTAGATTTPGVVTLDEPAAAEAALTGTKAAALARAATADLPIVPGFVLTLP